MIEDPPGQPDPGKLLQLGLSDTNPATSHSGERLGWSPPEPIAIDKEIEGYEILDFIGRGGMAAVYRAKNPKGDLVAIKILPQDLSSNPVHFKRFESEIQILSSLDHPNLVKVHGAGSTASGLPFYVMEEMKGGDLATIGQLPLASCLNYMTQICDSLDYLHKAGLLHRDLKPSNLLLSEDLETVKIADFGLARSLNSNPTDFSLTRTGTQVGTLHFVAPELLKDPDQLSIKSDLYSAAVVFFHLLTNRLPVGHYDLVTELPEINSRGDAFFKRALHSDVGQRFSSAREFQEEMHRAFFPHKKFTRRKAIATGSLLAIGAGVAHQLLKSPDNPPLVSGISSSPKFEILSCHPWTSPEFWGDLSPEQIALNDFVANPGAHLFHLFEGESVNEFPGKSLTLRHASSLRLASLHEVIHVNDLRLDGGTLSGDLIDAVKPELYPDLFNKVALLSGNKAILDGKISILQTSVFSLGRSGIHQLTIQATIKGTSPIYVAPPREAKAIVLLGDNRDFSGGWLIQGYLACGGTHALGTGSITIDRGSLAIQKPTEIAALRLEQNGVLLLETDLKVSGATINGQHLEPGTYQAKDFLLPKLEVIQGPGKLFVSGRDQKTPDIFQSKIIVADGAGEVVTAKSSQRWDRAETWDGPAPAHGRLDASGLTVSPHTYLVPKGIILREYSQPSGLKFFGGRALTLEPGSILEIDGGMGFLGFAELRLNGGEIHYGRRFQGLARELIGGTIIVNATTRFIFPDRKALQYKDFILQGKLRGQGDIHIFGSHEEYLYLNADTSEYSGAFHIEQGTLALMKRNCLENNEVFMKKSGCYLRAYCPGPMFVAKITMSLNSKLDLRHSFLHVGKLTIEGEQIPDGEYTVNSPELKGVVMPTRRPLKVGDYENS